MNPSSIPVITIDGPSGCGKGTLSQSLAAHLKWHFLDSGSLYRVLALAAQQQTIPPTDEVALSQLARTLDVRFKESHLGDAPTIFLAKQDVSEQIRSEQCGNLASSISSLKAVREALIERQRAFRRPPGLVTDGRDMGTIIFPDAQLKIFLDATTEERAQRRFKQLQNKGLKAEYATIYADLAKRDERDRTRTVAPLLPAQDAVIIDTTHLGIGEVFDRILELIKV